jgi:hypothetical protein
MLVLHLQLGSHLSIERFQPLWSSGLVSSRALLFPRLFEYIAYCAAAGGHTGEMIKLISKFNLDEYKPLYFVIAHVRALSLSDARILISFFPRLIHICDNS